MAVNPDAFENVVFHAMHRGIFEENVQVLAPILSGLSSVSMLHFDLVFSYCPVITLISLFTML